MKIGSLFSGYGGLEQGVQSVLGGTVAWHSEVDPGACKILAHRYPDVPNLGDITTVDWSAVEPVDVLTGGSPCQDLSHAGKRGGMTEGTRSNLWVAMRDAIEQLRPSLVVWENVRGAYSAPADSELESREGRLGVRSDGPVLRALGRVLGDLSELGFDAEWVGIRAADVGAPHGRFRVFVVAWPATDASGVRGERRRVDGDVAGPSGTGEADGGQRQRHGDAPDDRSAVAWGQYELAVRRWERLTRPAPSPTEVSAKGSPRLSSAFVEWMQGLPAGWVTDVPRLTRNEQLKALGNGVVPQQAAQALRLLLTGAVPAPGVGAAGLLPTPIATDGNGGPKRIRPDGRTEADHGPQLRDLAPTFGADAWVIGDSPLPSRCGACERIGTFPICCVDHQAQMCPGCSSLNHEESA